MIDHLTPLLLSESDNHPGRYPMIEPAKTRTSRQPRPTSERSSGNLCPYLSPKISYFDNFMMTDKRLIRAYNGIAK